MEPQHYIALGKMEATVKSLQSDVSDIKADQKDQNRKLDLLLAEAQRRRGARALTKVLIGLVTSGGFVGWLVEHFGRHP